MAKIKVDKVAELTGHKDSIYCLASGAQPNEFFSVGGDGFVIQWDLNDTTKGRLLARVPNSVYSCKYDSDLQYLYVAQNFSGLHIIDLNTREEVASIKMSGVSFFSITFNDQYIFVGSEIGEIYKIDKSDYSFQRYMVSAKSIRSLQIINGDQLLCGSSDKKIKIIGIDNMNVISEKEVHDNSIFDAKLHDNKIYSVSRDARIKVSSYASLNQIQEIPAHIYPINSLDFSATQNLFATGSMDKTVKIWNADTCKLLKVIDQSRNEGHTSSVNSLLWTSHKNQLISCGDDRRIIIWSINAVDV